MPIEWGLACTCQPPPVPDLPSPRLPFKPQLGSLNATNDRDKRGAGPSHMFFVLRTVLSSPVPGGRSASQLIGQPPSSSLLPPPSHTSTRLLSFVSSCMTSRENNCQGEVCFSVSYIGHLDFGLMCHKQMDFINARERLTPSTTGHQSLSNISLPGHF